MALIENGILNKLNDDEAKLEEFVIPSGVTALGDELFKYNRLIQSIVIPPEVTSFGDAAFYGCAVENLELWGKVDGLDNRSLWGAHRIRNIVITDQLKRTKKLSQFMRGAEFEDFSYNITVYSNATGRIKCIVPMHSDGTYRMRDGMEAGWRKDNSYDYSYLERRFPYIKVAETKANIAVTRLMFPFELTKDGRDMYVEHLLKNAKRLLLTCIRNDDFELFVFFDGLGLLNENTIKETTRLAEEHDNKGILTYLQERNSDAKACDKYSKEPSSIRYFSGYLDGLDNAFRIKKFELVKRY